MSKRLDEIARRKQALVAKAGRERAELATAWSHIYAPFDVTSILAGITRRLKSYPMIAASVSGFLVSGYISKLVKSSGKIFIFWRLARPFWAWWRRKRKG